MTLKNFLVKQIITKTVQVIIQNRIDVKKAQMKQLTAVMQQIHRNWQGSFGGSLQTFLNQLLLKQMYGVRNKIQNNNSQSPMQSVMISFYLNEKRTGNQLEVQHWELTFQSIGEQDTKQCGTMIVYFFQQLMLLLNRQPLFKQYQKSKYIKNCYTLDHKCQFFQKNKEFDSQGHILNIPAKYQKIRASHGFSIDLTCYYVTSLSSLCGKQPLIYPNNEKNYRADRRKSSGNLDLQQTASSLQKKAEQFTKSQRKTSVYTFYDQQLDITFISSDNQAFKNSEQEGVQKYEIQEKDIKQEQSQQFEMLFVGEDQSFVDSNIELLQKMIQYEKKYFDYY